jgi:hypothetical protein
MMSGILRTKRSHSWSKREEWQDQRRLSLTASTDGIAKSAGIGPGHQRRSSNRSCDLKT